MNVLIVGLGSIAQKHISALQELEKDVHFYALRSSKSATPVAGVTDMYSFEEADKIEFDFAIVSNPTSQRTEVLLQLVKRTIPLFIEKPISHELGADELKLQQWLNEYKIKNYIAYVLRYHPVLQQLNAYLQFTKPRIEEVNIYCGTYLPNWRPNVDFRKVYSSIPELGGGVHLDMSHELDYAFWLFGKPLHVSRYIQNKSSLQIAAVDYANYILEYNDFTISIILNYYRKEPKRTIEVVTDTGVINGNLIEWSLQTPDTAKTTFDIAVQALYTKQMEDFLQLITTGVKNIPNTYSDSMELMKNLL